MQLVRMVHYYVKRISHTKKRLIVVGAAALAVGFIAGNTIGSSRERAKAEEQMKQVSARIKEEQKKTDAIQDELERTKQEYEIEENKEIPWYLTLVNRYHPMEEGYVPELTAVTSDYSVDSRIVEPLQEMLEAAEKEGVNIIICSAYRSVTRQTQVFNESVQDRLDTGMNYWEAFEDTSRSVAIPGQSEHGLGLSLDLISNQYTELDEKQAETKEAKWLEENCYKYGFILRYPPSKTHETGIIYEPWHYRYVGKEDAEKIMKSGVTLEEYLKEEY